MSVVKREDERKWTNAFLAVICLLVSYLSIKFLHQIGEWFNLEARVQYFFAITQGVSVVFGATVFIIVYRHQEAAKYLSEVFSELVKVVWPESESVLKLAIGIIIGIAIVSGILVLIDYIFRFLLGFVY